MNKTLRTLALAAFALPLVASAQLEFNLEEVWVNGVQNGVANPIPGIDGGWGNPTVSDPGTATVSRFGVGKGGKIYTTSHKDNAIITYDGLTKEVSVFAKLSPVTVTAWGENNTHTPAVAKWNGTAISTDDAGNIIFNYCFIDPTLSVMEWGVANPQGEVTDITLATPVESLGLSGRLDIIGHIVGDVTSEKGGIGYATTSGSGVVVMFHFKGDGSKVTSLTAKASPNLSDELGAMGGLVSPSPKYATVDEILNSDAPELAFYAPYGADHATSPIWVGNGYVTDFDKGLMTPFEGIGNRRYLGSAVFSYAGRQYMVRNYVDSSVKDISIYSTVKGAMTIGVFDMKTGQCVASWMNSDYCNSYGMGTISVEPVDENTFNIYTYAATGTKDDLTPTLPGAYAAMLKLTVGGEAAPDGTEANPYQIATADDLGNMWKLMKPDAQTYFVQTADIDMTGVEEYIAPNGHSGEYNRAIHYDGQNHVIKNFAPKYRIAGVGDKAYYSTTVFGVILGTVKNLGIVDAYSEADWFEGGILAGFFGGLWVPDIVHSIDNVFVTGKSVGGSTTTVNGAIGTTADVASISNFYAQVTVESGAKAGGLVGNLGATLSLDNSYVSATVSGTETNLVANGGDNLDAANVFAFGSGVAPDGVTVVPAGDANAIAAIQNWDAFNEGKLFNGLPALNWQNTNVGGIGDIIVDSNDAPAVYYNLQGVEVANPDNGIFIVRRGNKVSKEFIRK